MKLKTIKVKSCLFIIKTIKNKSIIKSIISYILQLLRFSLEEKDLSFLDIEYQNSWIITKLPTELLIETSLLILFLLYNDLKITYFQEFQKILDLHYNKLIESKSLLIKSRFCCLLSKHFYEDNNELFLAYSKFLFS